MKSSLALLGSLLVTLLSACGGGAANNTANIPDAENVSLIDNTVASSGNTIYCAVVEDRVSQQDCEDLTREDAEVRRGAAAFNVPDPMARGATVQVHLIVDRRSPRLIRILEARVGGNSVPIDGNMMMANTIEPDGNMMMGNTSTIDGNMSATDPQNMVISEAESGPTPTQVVNQLEGTPDTFYPMVGRHMRAELTGQGFEIVPRSEASQEIPLGGQATWIWDVTAREGGARSLTLVTVVEGLANGRHHILARTPTVRNVTVNVSWSNRIWDMLNAAPTWIKAITAVVVAIGGLLTALYGLRWFRRRRGSGSEAGSDKDADDAAGVDGGTE